MNTLIGYYSKYPIYVSDKKDKKYYTIVNNNRIYFGQQGYQHFYDKFRYYKDLDHNDLKRRRMFKIRFQKLRKIKGTPSYFSDKILW